MNRKDRMPKTDKDTGMPVDAGAANKDEMRRTVKTNIASKINEYIRNNAESGMTQASFAQKIGASTSSFNRWASHATADLPPVHWLKPIANEIGITVDSLITGSDVVLAKPTYGTYADAFLSMTELVRLGLILPRSEDPFLNYLICRQAQNDSMENVSSKKKEGWVSKVVGHYNLPILPKYLTQYINLFMYEYPDIEEYDTYLGVFYMFQDYASGKTKAQVDGLIQKWHDSVEKGTGAYKDVQVPYWGGDKLCMKGEDGKVILVDKPKKEKYISVASSDIPIDPDDL